MNADLMLISISYIPPHPFALPLLQKANIHISGVGDIIKSFDKKSTTKDTLPTSFLGSVSLATAFQHYGDALRENGDQTVLTTALLKLGEAQSAINKHRIAADTDVQDKFLKPLCNFIINEGKQNTKMKETFGKAKKSYEADLSRVRENEASRVADLQKTYSSLVDYHSSSTEFFFTQHHYQETLDKINLESKADIMKGIKEFICAQKNFFQNALSSLETLEKNITELDNAAQMVFLILLFIAAFRYIFFSLFLSYHYTSFSFFISFVLK